MSDKIFLTVMQVKIQCLLLFLLDFFLDNVNSENDAASTVTLRQKVCRFVYYSII